MPTPNQTKKPEHRNLNREQETIVEAETLFPYLNLETVKTFAFQRGAASSEWGRQAPASSRNRHLSRGAASARAVALYLGCRRHQSLEFQGPGGRALRGFVLAVC